MRLSKKSSSVAPWLISLSAAVSAPLIASNCSLEPLEPPGAQPGSVLLVVPADGDPLSARMQDDLSDYLAELVGVETLVFEAPPGDATEAIRAAARENRAGLVFVVDAHAIAPSWLSVDAGEIEGLQGHGFVVEAVDDGDWSNGLSDGSGATILATAGGTKLAKQHAAYEGLRRLGVRFYHPEQEYVPSLPARQIRARAKAATVVARDGQAPVIAPDFAHRSFSFHGSHPLEHLESFSDGEFPIDEAEHVNDWIIKNFGTRHRGAGRGIASDAAKQKRVDELEELRLLLGMERTTGISLHNQQQGATAEIDPESPVPVKDQIEMLVEQKLAEAPDAIHFGIHFGPTEFTVTPDEETVQWLNWAGLKAKELRPDLPVFINDHITGTQPTPNFDDLGCPPGTNSDGRGDYYDLAFHTDPSLGVSVHTVMFHPLEGPAPVYKQVSFSHKRCLMERASSEGRPLQWYPEGSWWLSYDNTIPTYLPLYIMTRGRDFELVAPLLEKEGGSLRDFRMFNSGHEWGYWQQDYAVGLWGMNVDIPLEEVLGEIADPFCAPSTWPESCGARDEAVAVLLEMMDFQWRKFLDEPDFLGRPGGLFTYFSGEDPADEVAAIAGFEFRPVPVTFEAVSAFSDSQATTFRVGDLKSLEDAEARFASFRERLEAVAEEIPAAGRPWFDEIYDGVEIMELRARQSQLLYNAVLAYRTADKDGGDGASAASSFLADAAETLVRAEGVIRRREAAYRYPPEQVYGGGLTPETAVENGTTYPFRVHTQTHVLSYWHNRHERASDVVQGLIGPGSGLVLEPVFAPPGEALSIVWPATGEVSGAIELGDGTTVDPSVATHDFGPAEGAWAIGGTLTIDGITFPIQGAVARTQLLYRTDAGSLELSEPQNELAASVVTDVAPAFHWALVSDASLLAFGPAGPLGDLSYANVRITPYTSDGASLVTDPIDFAIPVQGGGSSGLALRVRAAVAQAELDGGELSDRVDVEGELVVGDIADALISLAGYDEEGAYLTLGDVLGFDPAAPPETVPFVAAFPVQADE